MKPKLLPVENVDGLFRDTSSGAIVNLNDAAYNEHKKKRLLADMKKVKLLTQEQEINNLKNDVKDLKSLVKQLLEKLDNGNT